MAHICENSKDINFLFYRYAQTGQLVTHACPIATHMHDPKYCRTHNVSVCLYIACIACGSASLYIKTLHFFLTVLSLSAAATVANIKIRYDAKTPQFAIFGTRLIYVFYSKPNSA